MEELSSRISALALHPQDVVLVAGLEKTPHYNYRAAVVLEPLAAADASAPPPPPNDRIPIALLHGNCKKLSVRRRNLLRASSDEERAMLLTRIVVEHQLELRVARSFLLDMLQGEEGLLLHIASFFPARETMALTTGFAMGRIVPSWCCADLTPAGKLAWRPLHRGGEGWDGANVPVGSGSFSGGGAAAAGAHRSVPDGIVRIDCAVIDVGAGRYLVAGGCADHPSRARAFFKSAFVYDSLTHVATPLPDMPCRRHGCDGAFLGGKAYVVGGEYVNGAGGGGLDVDVALVSCFDFASQVWSSLDAPFDPEFLRLIERDAPPTIAFNPVGAIGGRLFMLVDGLPLAFNPLRPAMGWRLCAPNRHAARQIMAALDLGTSACACASWGEYLVISSGRNGASDACRVAAFRFDHAPDADADADREGGGVSSDDEAWARGRWAYLGTTGATGRVGAGLVVVHDRLYISGGVHEGPGGGFDESVVCWGGSLADLEGGSPGGSEGRGAEQPEWDSEMDVRVSQVAIDASHKPWRRVDGLNLPTAMHAHEAIAIPWLPHMP